MVLRNELFTRENIEKRAEQACEEFGETAKIAYYDLFLRGWMYYQDNEFVHLPFPENDPRPINEIYAERFNEEYDKNRDPDHWDDKIFPARMYLQSFARPDNNIAEFEPTVSNNWMAMGLGSINDIEHNEEQIRTHLRWIVDRREKELEQIT